MREQNEDFVPIGTLIRMVTNADEQIIAVLALLIRQLCAGGHLDLAHVVAPIERIRHQWPVECEHKTYALDLLLQYLGAGAGSSPPPSGSPTVSWLREVIEGGLSKSATPSTD